MKITAVKERGERLVENLVKVWKSSVKVTHAFLSDEEITHIQQYVPQALRAVPHLLTAETEEGEPAAFMGISGRKLEMLFVADEARGKGLGKALLLHGIEYYSINEVAVNEQNPLAKGFYEHMGFGVYARSETDEQGKPYPLLYMKLKAQDGERKQKAGA